MFVFICRSLPCGNGGDGNSSLIVFNAAILFEYIDLINYACQLSKSCSSHYVELGYQQRLMRSYGRASEAFARAGEMEQGNILALLGQVSVNSSCVLSKGVEMDSREMC